MQDVVYLICVLNKVGTDFWRMHMDGEELVLFYRALFNLQSTCSVKSNPTVCLLITYWGSSYKYSSVCVFTSQGFLEVWDLSVLIRE